MCSHVHVHVNIPNFHVYTPLFLPTPEEEKKEGEEEAPKAEEPAEGEAKPEGEAEPKEEGAAGGEVTVEVEVEEGADKGQ